MATRISPLQALDNAYPLQHMDCKHGVLTWREAKPNDETTGPAAGALVAGQHGPHPADKSTRHPNPPPTLVLLHGIGSGALSWVAQLQAFGTTHRVLAWDAPGYGESSPLPTKKPLATDYAQVLDEWLQHCGVQDLVLVGHSLGALMAGAWAAQRHGTPASGAKANARLRALVLASPARGYGHTPVAERQAKWLSRSELINRVGPQAMAEQRAQELCAPGAPYQVVEQVRWNMARTTRVGYAAAAHLLAFDDLLKVIQGGGLSPTAAVPITTTITAPITVLCGGLDKTTPPAACQSIAHALNAPLQILPGVAHPCYAEDPAGFNAVLADCIAQGMAPQATADNARR